MSAVAMIVRESYAIIAGDGVSTDPVSGVVGRHVSKLTILPHLNAVIGLTGIEGFDQLMGFYMPASVTDFDSLLDALPSLAQRVSGMIAREGLLGDGDIQTSVVIAGWSGQRQAYEGWRLVTYPKQRIHPVSGVRAVLEPWTPHRIQAGTVWCSTDPGREAMQKFGLFDEHGDDDAAHLTRLLASARSKSGEIGENGQRFNAGGFIQVAVIQTDDIRSWIAHRWPEDLIGAPVDPARGMPMPEWLHGA